MRWNHQKDGLTGSLKISSNYNPRRPKRRWFPRKRKGILGSICNGVKDKNPLPEKWQLLVQREEHRDRDKEWKDSQGAREIQIHEDLFVLTNGSKGSLCCKDACKECNKWMTLWKIKKGVLRSRETAVRKFKSRVDLSTSDNVKCKQIIRRC